MRTGKARNNSGDDWKTPDWFYNKLNNIYHFDLKNVTDEELQKIIEDAEAEMEM